MARYRGRHRKPTTTGKVIARTAIAGAVAGAGPLLLAPAAHAASDGTWDRLAQCESSGNWAINTGNGYHGGLQFSPRTWTAFGGGEFAPVAYQASREQQIVVAERVLAAQGWNAWPSCSRKLGIRGEPAAQRGAPAAAPQQQVRLSAPAQATSGNYTVRRGDTLYRIAQRNHIPGGWRTLVQKNPGLAANPAALKVGQQITL